MAMRCPKALAPAVSTETEAMSRRRSQKDVVSATVWTLSNGVTVWVKPTEFKDDEIVMRATSPGGWSRASLEDHQSAAMAAGLVQQGDLDRTSAREDLRELLRRAWLVQCVGSVACADQCADVVGGPDRESTEASLVHEPERERVELQTQATGSRGRRVAPNPLTRHAQVDGESCGAKYPTQSLSVAGGSRGGVPHHRCQQDFGVVDGIARARGECLAHRGRIREEDSP